MTVLTVDSVSLSFGVTTILEDISFSINEGDKLGIIGVNRVWQINAAFNDIWR